MDLLQQRLDLGVGVELPGFLLQYQVGPHAAPRELPDAFLILGAVRVGVKVARALVAFLLQQLDQEESALLVL